MTQKTDPNCDVCGGVDAELDLANAMLASFCRALESSGLPPMQVLQMMARSLGGVYREVASQHQQGKCPCGWLPNGLEDIELIHRAINIGVARSRQTDLRSMAVAGRA